MSHQSPLVSESQIEQYSSPSRIRPSMGKGNGDLTSEVVSLERNGCIVYKSLVHDTILSYKESGLPHGGLVLRDHCNYIYTKLHTR